MKIAGRMRGLKPSVGFELLKLGKALKAKGEDVISLAIGELEEKTYKPIREAGQRAIEEGWTKYSPSAGREALRKKLSQEARREFGWPVEPENIFIGNGCKAVLFASFQSLCGEGDEVLLPAPYWMSYPPLIKLSGASLKIIPAKEENGFKITAKELEESLSEKTKAFLLNSPNNPTGAIYSEKELKSLGEAIRRHPQLTVVLDSIYDRIVYSGKRAPHLLAVCPDLKDQTLAVSGASKNYLMTGWRLGWLAGPKEFVKVISAFQSQSLSCANSIAQKAFEDGFELCEGEIKSLVQKLSHTRGLLTEGLQKISGLKAFPPQGAFYFWLGVKNFIGKKLKGQRLNSSQDIMQKLLEDKKLLCICGEEFGRPGYLRLSFSTEEEIAKKAIARLQDFFSSLKS